MKRTLIFVVNIDWFFLSHRLPIAQEAIKQGYEVHIATGVTDRICEIEEAGIIVHPISLARGGLGIKNAISSAIQIAKIFRKIRPDIAHLVTIKPILIGGIVARLTGVPSVVFAIAGLGYVFMAQGLASALRRMVVGMLYKVALGHQRIKLIFQNKDDIVSLRRVAKIYDADVALIKGSGVNLEKYCPMPLLEGVPNVLMAARLLADKGVAEFVDAARILKAKGCLANFVLVGAVDPSNPTSFTNIDIDAWVKEGLVDYWGQKNDMHDIISQARIVVLPSYREGLPKVLIEAAACGRAVVTTDVPGCRDAIEADITGLLVPVRNAPALAAAIEYLLNDPIRCGAMGLAGREFAEKNFDIKSVVSAHLKIYEEIVES